MAPAGFKSFQKQAAVVSARREARSAGGDGPRVRINYFSLQDGEEARVRFLEQGEEIAWAQCHRIRNQWGYFNNIPCLDQFDDGTSCPACQSDSFDIRKRSTRGFVNVIWRGNEDEGLTRAPVYKRNEKGSIEKNQMKQKIIIGFEDQVFMWECSKEVLESLEEKDAKYKGLMSRDFNIKRKGAAVDNTSYSIEPSVIDGGPEGMTVADGSLSQGKFDTVAITTPGSYENMAALLSQQEVAPKGSTFSRDSIQPDQSDIFNGEPPARSSAFNR